MKSGAEILLQRLIEKNIDKIFGYPGGAIMPVYDALLNYSDQISHYRTAHEQGAVHAADGYARASGKVGICFVTSGPGATNAVTGIATAYLDSVPLVIFTGQVPTALLGKDSFQEIDISSICEAITKKTFQIEDVNQMAHVVDEAIKIALSGRPGPVLVDLPKDILLMETDYYPKNNMEIKEQIETDSTKLVEIANQINASKRPILYVGGGIKISDASKELYEISKLCGIPVVNTLMGLGSFPSEDPLSLGLSGMHGHPHANKAIQNCDLLIVIGARFSDRSIGKSTDFASQAKIIHLDIDETEFSKNIRCTIHLKGDLKMLLSELKLVLRPTDYIEWRLWINNQKHEPVAQSVYCPRNILRLVNEQYYENTVLTTDVGQHQMWSAQYWRFNHDEQFITSGGLGTMGYGLGAAIGASVGKPDKSVVLITGDGSFRMNCNELLTVARYKLPITIVLMNNQSLGMVRQWQKLFHKERYSETDNDSHVNYMTLCSAYGIPAEKVSDLETLKHVLEQRKLVQGPFFIEVMIDKDEDVYPIVPPGNSIVDFRLQ